MKGVSRDQVVGVIAVARAGPIYTALEYRNVPLPTEATYAIGDTNRERFLRALVFLAATEDGDIVNLSEASRRAGVKRGTTAASLHRDVGFRAVAQHYLACPTVEYEAAELERLAAVVTVEDVAAIRKGETPSWDLLDEFSPPSEREADAAGWVPDEEEEPIASVDELVRFSEPRPLLMANGQPVIRFDPAIGDWINPHDPRGPKPTKPWRYNAPTKRPNWRW